MALDTPSTPQTMPAPQPAPSVSFTEDTKHGLTPRDNSRNQSPATARSTGRTISTPDLLSKVHRPVRSQQRDSVEVFLSSPGLPFPAMARSSASQTQSPAQSPIVTRLKSSPVPSLNLSMKDPVQGQSPLLDASVSSADSSDMFLLCRICEEVCNSPETLLNLQMIPIDELTEHSKICAAEIQREQKVLSANERLQNV